MPLALGGLGDLLDRRLPEVADELAEPQRRALAVAVGLEAPPDEPPEHLVAFRVRSSPACGRSLLALRCWSRSTTCNGSTRRRSGSSPSPPDASATLPSGSSPRERGDAGDPLDLRRALDERFTEIRLGPLSVGALHHLIRTRLGVRIPRPTLARIHQASGGNPMFALEFAKVAASASAPLPMPSSLEELVRERVAGLPPEVLPLLAAVAAAERPTPALLEAVIDDARELLDAASRRAP